MKKQEWINALTAQVDEKLNACTERIQSLAKEAETERMALSIQRNLYTIAKTAVEFAGCGEAFPRPFIGQLTHLLAEEDALRDVLAGAEGEEQKVLAIYLYNMLFLRDNFLRRYIQEAESASAPRKQFEANLKYATVEDLMTAYRTCFASTGGRKVPVI